MITAPPSDQSAIGNLQSEIISADAAEISDNQLELFLGDNRPLVDTSKPELNYTAERLWRERPDVAKACIKLLAEHRDFVSYRRIMGRCHVSYHTLRALENRNSADIKSEKKNLGDIMHTVTQVYAERALDPEVIASTKGKDAVLAAAIASDKYLQFRGEATQVIDLNVKIDDNRKRLEDLTRLALDKFEQMKRAAVVEISPAQIGEGDPQISSTQIPSQINKPEELPA